MTHQPFTFASSPARARALARTAAFVNGYRNLLSLYYLAWLLAALDQASHSTLVSPGLPNNAANNVSGTEQ